MQSPKAWKDNAKALENFDIGIPCPVCGVRAGTDCDLLAHADAREDD